MFERFTDRARKVMALANQEAHRLNHPYIGTEHILLGLVNEGTGVGPNVLKNLEVDLSKVRVEVEKLVKSGPDKVTLGKLPQTPRAKKAIECAIEEARNLNHNYVGTEHLLLGLLRERDGAAAQVLMDLSLKLEDVREEVLDLLGGYELRPEAAPQPSRDLSWTSILNTASPLDRYFLQMRHRALNLAADLDRIDRAAGAEGVRDDPRLAQVKQAIEVLADGKPEKIERAQMAFSLPYAEGWREEFGV